MSHSQDWRDAFIRRLAPQVMEWYGFSREESILRLCKLSNEGLKRFNHKVKWHRVRMRRGIEITPKKPSKLGPMKTYAVKLPTDLARQIQQTQELTGEPPSKQIRSALIAWFAGESED